MEILRTGRFNKWLLRLKDHKAKARILIRIDRLGIGHFGTVNAVGEGVSELKIDVGKGYRVYYIQRGAELVVLLCGGEKSSQSSDIKLAQKMAKDWKSQ